MVTQRAPVDDRELPEKRPASRLADLRVIGAVLVAVFFAGLGVALAVVRSTARDAVLGEAKAQAASAVERHAAAPGHPAEIEERHQLEARQLSVERDVSGIKADLATVRTDVSWIRAELERQLGRRRSK